MAGRSATCRAADVRATLGVVSQRVHLFNASVRDNLAVADPDATDAEMEAACRMAQVHETIVALPEGYETQIGEDGVRLSGGERQRLAIARAILKDAPILVLDEATANLDVLTEQRLLGSLGAVHRRADDPDHLAPPVGGRARRPDRAPRGWPRGRDGGRMMTRWGTRPGLQARAGSRPGMPAGRCCLARR